MKNIVKTEQKGMVNTLFIGIFDIYDSDDDRRDLVELITKLSKGKFFFYSFRREEDIFLTYDELVHYRSYIPQYFESRGKYQILRKRDETMFDSYGMLPVNDFSILFTLNCWQYFWSMSFFCPSDNFSWENYLSKYNDLSKDLYGIKQITNGYSDSIFIRGHDGESLIFSYHIEKYKLPQIDILEA